jgi:phage I-like protein
VKTAVVQNTAVFKPLTNRSADSTSATFALPADRFVQLVPKGEAPNVLEEGKSTKRIIQVVDEEALGQIMSKLLNRGGEMLIDDEHHSHDLDKSTDANGWQLLNKDTLQVREDGLYGDPRCIR